MQNLVNVLALQLQAGQLTPCVRIQHGIFNASQQGAPFFTRITYQYTSGGNAVSSGNIDTPLSTYTLHEEIDNVFLDVHGTAFQLASPLDAGTNISVTIGLGVTSPAGADLIAVGQATTQSITPTIIGDVVGGGAAGS
jgi:hypothetical protein